MNKASGGNGIPAELFKILEDIAIKVLHSVCQQVWKIQQWPQDWKRSVSTPIPKKGSAKECSNYNTIMPITLKILQARLQWYLNQELPDVQAGFWRSRGTRDQIAMFVGSWRQQGSSRKTFTSASLTMLKLLTVDHNKLWKILKEMGIPDHLTCLQRNLYVGQKASVRTRHGTSDWFKIEKGVWQGCILLPY